MDSPNADGYSAKRPPWFAGRPGTVLLYRVNRRPLPRPTLGGRQPESVMDHIIEVLPFGLHVTTGTSHKRDWILGNRVIASNESALSGQVGWEQRGEEESTGRYDPETREWLDVVEPQDRSARAPFVFDAQYRVLGVLKHRSFNESVIAKVFQALLREGENAREWPSTEWSVEPILDERDFLAWLHSVQSVVSVNIVAKMPNPDGLEEFGPIWEEMNQRRARLISTRILAANDEVGLEGLEDDERVMGGLAMGRNGFGHVEAQGYQNGHKTIYDQREKTRREVTDELGPTWTDAVNVMIGLVRRSATRALARRDGT